MNKIKEFNCAKCGVRTSKTVSNYYTQRKKLSFVLCGPCGIKRNNENSSIRIIKFNKSRANIIKRKDKITVICPICNKSRIIRFIVNVPPCPNCAGKIRYQNNQEKYRLSVIRRTNDVNFNKKVSIGLMTKLTFEQRSQTSKSHNYWNDPIKKAEILTKRNTEEYRRKMREIWNRPGYRNSASKRAQKLAIQLWKNKDYREKQAHLRLYQNKTSSQQLILYSLLDDLKIKYYKDSDEKCKIGYYTFDCRIDPQEEIKLEKPLFIEVQGTYWHNLPKGIRNDKSKATYLSTYFKEYNLKYLWEHEFDNKDRVINLLKYWLGLSELSINKIEFHDIQEKIIDYKEAELFISKYHYAGRIGRSGINLGYFSENELIGVIIYASPIRIEVVNNLNVNYKDSLELSRLVIHPQYQIKNLASHIISRSINYIKQNKLEIKCLISFADSTYNHLGIIYKASNWEFISEVPSDYWYVDKDGYVCHKKTLWNKASKNSMTEKEYSEKYNYSKVWGKPKNKYAYYIK